VTLRPPDERDLAAIDLGIHDPDVVRWFGTPTSSAPDVLAANRERWQRGSPTFSILETEGQCVGHVWLNVSTTDASLGYVGCWLLPEALRERIAPPGCAYHHRCW
jgi:RimJ/RimL family protein N-acetyltransferase